MVLAHAATMNRVDGRTFDAAPTDGGGSLTVHAPPKDVAKLKGLGFFGVLTLGMHHEMHHLMIARGQNPHPCSDVAPRRQAARLAGKRLRMTHASETAPLVLDAWRCIGCGRIEGPQPCIGVCQDRKVQFVYAAEHTQALARLAEAESRRGALESLVRRLATTRPRAGEWERSYRALQDEARRALAALSPAPANRAPAETRPASGRKDS